MAKKVSTIDAVTQNGIARIQMQLVKHDPTLNLPLRSDTWARDIVADTGGGPEYAEFSSYIFGKFGSAANGGMSLLGTNTNDIVSAQADVETRFAPAYKVGINMVLSHGDLMASNDLQLGPKIEELLDTSVRLNYDITLQENAYVGLKNIKDTFGLINNPEVTITSAVHGDWTTKTPVQILEDINTAITTVWDNCGNDLSAMPNHILLPTQAFAYINGTMVSDAGSMSILTFLEQNNVAKSQGIDLRIFPLSWCNKRGANGSGRMVVYRNERRFVRFDIHKPLTALQTGWDPRARLYITPFEANIGVVKFLYTEPALYVDGIN